MSNVGVVERLGPTGSRVGGQHGDVAMSLHGLAEMTLGVPNVDATKQFYREFGLAEGDSGMFASADGGEQLRIVESPYRRLIEFALAADDPDDIARIRAAAAAYDIGYDKPSDSFVFQVTTTTGATVTASDALPASVRRPSTGEVVALPHTGAWVYLAAIYDRSDGTIRMSAHDVLAP